MAGSVDVSKYSRSPVHKAIATKDHSALRKILAGLPQLADPSEIRTEAASMAEEEKVEAISRVIDRRDNIPNRDTPLHLAVKLGDETAAEMLMSVGADWSLRNEQGWSALHESICSRNEGVIKIIVRHCEPLKWAKWCRRLPRFVAAMRRMRDFYMEITFHFESSVIPFISRIAPSDTYKIWKRGANLRADMTLAGFDGFRIQRADQSILFLGEGSEDGKLPPGSLCVISHKEKEIVNALEGGGSKPCECEVEQEVARLCQNNIFRPGINVSEAVLLPLLTWRRHEKSEMVGQWKAKVYEMHNVFFSLKSRKVPGATTDAELTNSCNRNETDTEELKGILTEEESKQLENALKMGSNGVTNDGGGDVVSGHRHSYFGSTEVPIDSFSTECKDEDECKSEKKGRFTVWSKRDRKNEDEKKLAMDGRGGDVTISSPPESAFKPARHSVDVVRGDEPRRGRDKKTSSTEGGNRHKNGSHDSEYKKGFRPILWLSPNFPLRIEELLPLLDILANKVKAVRRLRELLTTKLPLGTFPVKVAIPLIPAVRVLVTFTKFEELEPLDEFSTPPSSPEAAFNENTTGAHSSSSSWFRWRKASSRESSNSKIDVSQDPFAIPSDYKWVKSEANKKVQEKNKSKK